MKFTKMHGCGNDYIYVNRFEQPFSQEEPQCGERIRFLSDRHFGIGGDGVILISPSKIADARMDMYNSDGTAGAMCGNGVRCVAKFVHDHGIARKDEIAIETDGGLKRIRVIEKDAAGNATWLRVDMGEPAYGELEIPLDVVDVDGTPIRITPVSMGNPHGVVFVKEITDDHVFKIGPILEHHPLFPNRANIEFVQVLSSTELRMRVWERGSGETLACGTGASASCVASVLTQRASRSVTVHLIGGDLQIEWDEATNHVFMTGPATEVFSGEIAD